MFANWLLNTCKRFNETGTQIRQAMRIEMAFAKTPIVLSPEDWDAIREAANAPGAPYPVQPARALVPFIDAIDNAKVNE